MSVVLPSIDKQVFDRVASGDEQAFRQVVQFYYAKWLALTISLAGSEADARDILQDVFLKLWLSRSTLTFVDNPEAWLHTVVSNATSNYIRSRLRYELRLKKLIPESTDEKDLAAELDARFTQLKIDEAVEQLPEKRRQVFLLSRRQGLSRKEIAERLGISENTVRNQLTEAIEFIRKHVDRDGALLIPAIIFLQVSTN